MTPNTVAEKIMTEFAADTGLSDSGTPPRRYLWTDAYGVCNFLELYRRSGDATWRRLALRLVDQVHTILGRHREDDSRTGWISGLSEAEGRRHPTVGGLRIGKRMNERGIEDPFDDRLEWDRDGQYYHYLTRWMQALDRVGRVTEDPVFNQWAVELAKAAHAAFVYRRPDGSRWMNWKMSIDLSRPQVSSMGQHDPLDGLTTCLQLRATADLLSTAAPDLDAEIDDLAAVCRATSWRTGDPLGIGGLLCDAYRAAQLMSIGAFADAGLFRDLVESALASLKVLMGSRLLDLPDEERLAFRELGLAIGLHAVKRLKRLMESNPQSFSSDRALVSRLNGLGGYVALGETIEKFWLDPRRRQLPAWAAHRDINRVMLAASLAPDGCLELNATEEGNDG
jgi:hypothetical protein